MIALLSPILTEATIRLATRSTETSARGRDVREKRFGLQVDEQAQYAV